MNAQASHQLICVIVNAGYADDVMNAARTAGATGGTVINARGTGREEDVKLFRHHSCAGKGTAAYSGGAGGGSGHS